MKSPLGHFRVIIIFTSVLKRVLLHNLSYGNEIFDLKLDMSVKKQVIQEACKSMGLSDVTNAVQLSLWNAPHATRYKKG